jgi:hypothetical protein
MRRKKNFVNGDLGAFGGEDKQYRRRVDVERTRPIFEAGHFRTCACASALSFLLLRMDIVSREVTSEKRQKQMIARRLILMVGSTGRCNTLCQLVCWGLI